MVPTQCSALQSRPPDLCLVPGGVDDLTCLRPQLLPYLLILKPLSLPSSVWRLEPKLATGLKWKEMIQDEQGEWPRVLVSQLFGSPMSHCSLIVVHTGN